MSKLTDSIHTAITKVVEDLGYTVEYVENVKEGESKILRVVIDKENTSLTTDDCEIVSRKIEEKVDSLMKDEMYILEISSPGLEGQLKNTKLYLKYLGSKVLVKLYNKVENSKELEGILKEATDEYIVLTVEDKDIKIERENITCANTVYEF
jgi:ribosome maturation factor RimP